MSKTSVDTRPWVEKYRPRKIAEVSQQVEAKRLLSRIVATGNMPHLLFFGPPGSGKTSAALALVKELFGREESKTRLLELNASDERGSSTRSSADALLIVSSHLTSGDLRRAVNLLQSAAGIHQTITENAILEVAVHPPTDVVTSVLTACATSPEAVNEVAEEVTNQGWDVALLLQEASPNQNHT
ncbi:hypothetical protein Emed_004777 [Eimeria media]